MSKWKRKAQASEGNWSFMLKSLFKLFPTPENKGPTVQTNEHKIFSVFTTRRKVDVESN